MVQAERHLLPPAETDEATALVPEAVIEVIGKGYEAKDLEIGPRIYLSPGGRDVVVLDPDTLAVLHARRDRTARVAFSPDGTRAYVTNFNSWTVSVSDTQTAAVVDTLSTWGRPTHLAVNPNGAFVYVSGLGGHVQAIDTRTRDTVAYIAVDVLPRDLAAVLETRSATGATRDSGALDLGYHAPLP